MSNEFFYPIEKTVDSRYMAMSARKKIVHDGAFEPNKQEIEEATAFLVRHFPKLAEFWSSEVRKLSHVYPSSWWIKVFKVVKYSDGHKPFGYVVAVMDRWLKEGIPKNGVWDRFDNDMKQIVNTWKKPNHVGSDPVEDEKVDEAVAEATNGWSSRNGWSR